MIAKDSPPLPALLPYEIVDRDVAVLSDGSLGAWWTLGRWSCEGMSDEELGGRAARLAAWLRRLPERAVVQFALAVDPDVREITREYLLLTKERGVLRDAAASKAGLLERLSIEDRVRRMRLSMGLRIFPRYPRPPWILLPAAPGRHEERVRQAYLDERSRFAQLARELESGLDALGLAPRRSNEEALRAAIFRALNPDRERRGDRMPVRADVPLRDQVAYSAVDLDFSSGVVRIGATVSAVISVIELPGETRAGILEAALDPEADWVFNVECPLPKDIEKFLKTKKRLAFCQERGRDYQADMSAIKNEVDALLTEIFVEGSRVLSTRIHVILRARSVEALEERAGRLLNALHAAGFGAIREDVLAPALFLQCLPLAYDPRNDRALKRSRKLQDLNLAHLVPAYRPFAGTARPDLLLLNRAGEPVPFSFFDTDFAPHGIICGISGSGKSVLANHIILDARRRGARVFVLDRGQSYSKLCRMLGGQFVRLEPERPLGLNPLGRELTQERAVFATDFLSEMVTGGRFELGTRERSLLAQALRSAYTGELVTVSRVIESLERMSDPAAREMATSLRLFARGGPWGAYFDGSCELDAASPLMVFELEEAALAREASSTLLMAIIQVITDACVRDREMEKYLIVDEAWTLLKSPATARFLESVFRTYRKYRTSAVMITQQVADFEGTAGEAIRANAPNRFFLTQTPETIRAMEKLLDLRPREKELLSTVATVKGQYSEMLVVTPSSRGIARLVQDPWTYWLTTSDPKDNATIEALRRAAEARGDPDPLRSALREASLKSERRAGG